MDPAADALREALANTEIKTPRIPVVSNVDAKVLYKLSKKILLFFLALPLTKV